MALAELKAKMGLGPMPATRAALPEGEAEANGAAGGSTASGSKP